MFKKQFGQNFLRNTRFAHKLIEPLNLSPDDLVIEIGPGDGMVTKLLLDSGCKVVCVEVDYDLLANLIRKFMDNSNFKIVHKDILEFNIEEELASYSQKKIKVVGSLPYNISKKIIRRFLRYSVNTDAKFKVETMSFIVQDEVAKVYVARAPKSTFLSISSELYAEVKKLESIPSSQFIPKPKVDGGILNFRMRDKTLVVPADLVKFEKFLKAGFASSRKTLYNNLLSIREKSLVDQGFEDLKIDKNIRASEISLNLWIELYSKI